MSPNSARIYLVEQAGDLTPLHETPYRTEDDLQARLARSHELLCGDQINPENPRHWLLVKREMGVPAVEGGPTHWSLDHLFLDQEGIPTFVECKRAANTQIRREVVAQMLDYAANGLAYWGADRLRQAAAETHGDALDGKVRELCDMESDADIEDFWQKVHTNLDQGRIRLLFVADEVPRELRRLIDFLGRKMSADIEVLAIEVKQYLAEDREVLVPSLIGQTAFERLPRDKKPRIIITRADFLAQFSEPVRAFFHRVLDEADERKHIIYWGEKGFSVRTQRLGLDNAISFAFGYPGNTVDSRPEPVFDVYQKYLVDDSGLRDQILALSGFRLRGDYTLRCPLTETSIPDALEAWHKVLDIVDAQAVAKSDTPDEQ